MVEYFYLCGAISIFFGLTHVWDPYVDWILSQLPFLWFIQSKKYRVRLNQDNLRHFGSKDPKATWAWAKSLLFLTLSIQTFQNSFQIVSQDDSLNQWYRIELTYSLSTSLVLLNLFSRNSVYVGSVFFGKNSHFIWFNLLYTHFFTLSTCLSYSPLFLYIHHHSITLSLPLLSPDVHGFFFHFFLKIINRCFCIRNRIR